MDHSSEISQNTVCSKHNVLRLFFQLYRNTGPMGKLPRGNSKKQKISGITENYKKKNFSSESKRVSPKSEYCIYF